MLRSPRIAIPACLLAGLLLAQLPSDSGALTRNTQPPRAEILISAAISLKNVLAEISTEFQAASQEGRPVFNLGSSGQLRLQIESGAPADLFIPASPEDIDPLVKKNLAAPATRLIFASNRLALVISTSRSTGRSAGGSAAIKRPADIPGGQGLRFAIGNPATVPAGRYARDVLEHRGWWKILQDRLIFAENSRQTLDYVARGDADAGIVFATDAAPGTRTEPRIEILEIIPENEHRPIAYEAVLLRGGGNPAGARAFLNYLRSPAARNILKRHGFAP